MNTRKWIILAVLVAVIYGCLALAPGVLAEQAPFTLNGGNFFTVGIYGYPGLSDVQDFNAFFKELSDAGINTTLRWATDTSLPVWYLDDSYSYGMGVSIRMDALLRDHTSDPYTYNPYDPNNLTWSSWCRTQYTNNEPAFTDADGHTLTYKSDIDKTVAKAKNHPATLCYETIDEVYDARPDVPPLADPWDPPYQTAINHYFMNRLPHGCSYLNAQDPNHATLECYYTYDYEDLQVHGWPLDNCQVTNFRGGNTIGNSYGMWKYPAWYGDTRDDEKLSYLPGDVDMLMQIVNDTSKPTLMVVQGCAEQELDTDVTNDYWRPAWFQTRFSAYASIVHGAKGVWFWDPYYIERDSQFWAELKKVTGEIDYLKDVLNNGTTVSYNTGYTYLHSLLKTRQIGGTVYHFLFVDNEDFNPTTALGVAHTGLTIPAVSGWVGSTTRVLFENRYKTSAPPFTDDFAAWGVHVYTDYNDNDASTYPRSPVPFSAQQYGTNSIVLNWTNPTSTGFQGTMVRYKTTGYPTSATDGTQVTYQTNNPGSPDSYVQTGLTSGQTYYYSAFAYDGTNYSVATHAQAIPLSSVTFTDAFSYSNGALNGNGGWSGTAGAGAIDVSGSTVKISGGSTTVYADKSITCEGSGDKEIWVHCSVKAGVGDNTNDMWGIWIDDPSGNNLAHWYGTGTRVTGRIGSTTIVTPVQTLSGTSTWDDLHVKIFTTWGFAGKNGNAIPKKAAEFYFNGQFIGRLFYQSTGAGYTVGRVRFERTGNAGATGHYLYFDDLTVGTHDFSLPTVLSISNPSVYAIANGVSSAVTYTVSFNKSVTGFGSSGIRLYKTGTANASSIGVTGSGSGPYTVTLSNITGTGTVGFSVKPGSCIDPYGNPNTDDPDGSLGYQGAVVTYVSPSFRTPGTVPVTVELRKHDGPTTTRTVYVSSSLSSYILTDIDKGTYDFAFKASHWLRKTLHDVVVKGNSVTLTNVSLTDGDVDGDNDIDSNDETAVNTAMGYRPGWVDARYSQYSLWNPEADLDGNVKVDSSDLSIVQAVLQAHGGYLAGDQ